MLNDRDYMRGSAAGSEDRSRRSALNALWALIAVNILFWLGSSRLGFLALSSAGLKQGCWWQIVSAMFMHFDFWHLLVNMYGLWLFGSLAAPFLGLRRFLIVYFSGGIAGNLLYALIFWQRDFVLIGASGALFGIMLSVAMMMPEVRFLMLFVPVKASTLVVVYTAFELLGQLAGSGGIAHLAHLGGFVGAYIALKVLYGRSVAWDPLGFARGRGGPVSGGGGFRKSGFTVHSGSEYRSRPEDDDGSPVSQAEIDYLLDKISNSGINSLTPREHARLKRVREEMRRH